MNLLQFSQIPRYKLVRQNAENGWGRPTVYTDLRAHDRGEWMLVSDVRNLVVGDRPWPDVEGLVEALERIANLPMDYCSTENDYRLSAAKAMALAAVRDYRKHGGDV